MSESASNRSFVNADHTTSAKTSALPMPIGKRIDDIEVLRALAVLFTVFHHLPNLFPWEPSWYQDVTRYATFWGGVDLFFVISGFVIARDLLKHLHGATDNAAYWRACVAFWMRRAWRILPSGVLWMSLFLAAAAVFNASGAFGGFRANLGDAVASLIQVANFHFQACHWAHTTECGPNRIYWSLSLEEQFYWLFPLLIFLSREKLPYVLVAIVAAQIFIPRPLWHPLWAIRSDALALGVLLALWSQHPSYAIIEPRFLAHRSWLKLGLLLIGGACIALIPSDLNIVPFSTGSLAIVCALMVYVASYGQDYLLPGNRIARGVLLWLGSRSYAIYLTHMLAFCLTRELWFRLAPAGKVFGPSDTVYFLLTSSLLILIWSELNYRFLELPLRTSGRIIASRIERPEHPPIPLVTGDLAFSTEKRTY